MSHIDLNLIRTFLVLYETQSVTQCAEKLFITQPSVSYALSKLRELFNDQLFLRSNNRMEPTAVAAQLYQQFRPSLSEIENSVERLRDLDSVLSERRFTIALTDLGEVVQLPLIYNRMKQDTPHVKLQVLSVEVGKVVGWMHSGKVDAVICSAQLSDPRIKRKLICTDNYLCVAGRKNRLKKLSLDTFEGAEHIQVSHTQGHSVAEESIAAASIKHNISLAVPHFSSLPGVLVKSDLLAIVPSMIAKRYAEEYELSVFPLPFEVPESEISLYWPARLDSSRSHQWFLTCIYEALQESW